MGQFSNLVANKKDLTSGQQIKLFVSSAYGAEDVQPFKTADTAAAIAVADTTITLATGGFDVPLYEGTILAVKTSWTGVTDIADYYTKYYIVAAYSDAADTTITIEPADFTAASADEVRIVSWIPYFSVNNYSTSRSSNVISDNVFSGGLFDEKDITSISGTINTSGPFKFDDPGLDVLDTVQREGKRTFLTVAFPSKRGGKCGETIVSQLDDSGERGNFMQSTVNFEVSGELIKIPYIVP